MMRWLGTAALLLLAAGPGLAAPANKCVIDGQVTYQQGPCPSGQVRKPPTLEELNAAEKRRRAAAAEAANASTKSGAPPPQTSTPAPAPTPAISPRMPTYRCDGRRYCSQMSSCAEAKFFLANCPGVEMDGDKDGIPCEQQYCH
jgi:hypothetical protein